MSEQQHPEETGGRAEDEGALMAFPMATVFRVDVTENTAEVESAETGMTKRQYFAAHAPDVPPWMWNALQLQLGEQNIDGGDLAAFIADWRFTYADAMLERGQR